MNSERFLVTGGTGCIGSWTVRNLLKQSVPVVVLTMDDEYQRLRLILTPEEFNCIEFARGDITNLETLLKLADQYKINNVIHLAGLQLPFCKANPPLGAMVNVVGTINVFEMARQANISRVVYASSAAVYGPKNYYNDLILPHDAPFFPTSHYGVFKIANEQNASVFWSENQISSIGVRPHTVYGAGRDQGMTSKPTVAMIAAAAKRRYHISFGGQYQFQYADDVAKVFIQAARVPFEGATVFNVGGQTTSVSEIVKMIKEIEPAAQELISFDENSLPLPVGFDNQSMCSLLGSYQETSLQEGIHQTIEVYRQAINNSLVGEDYLSRIIGRKN